MYYSSLAFNGNPVYVGGIATVSPLLERPGQVHSDDFIGCLHSLEINGKSLNISAPIASRGISNSCQRDQNVCDSEKHKCGSHGVCIDLWDTYECRCTDVIAPNCNDALSSYMIKSGGKIEFKIRERFRRFQQLQNLRLRYPEDGFKNEDELISFDFRTTQPDGVLFFAATNEDYTLLQVINLFLNLNLIRPHEQT